MDQLWNEINEFQVSIEQIDAKIKEAKDSSPRIHTAAENKEIQLLKEQLEILEQKREEKRLEYQSQVYAFREQLCESATNHWIAKRKNKLLAIRAHEQAQKNAEMDKCKNLVNELMKTNKKYQELYKDNEEIKEIIKDKESKKSKKPKKSKRKKREILIDGTDLDLLAEKFKELSIPPPKTKEDIPKSMENLSIKMMEIESRPLTSTLGAQYENESPNTDDTLSFSNLSISSDQNMSLSIGKIQ